MREREDAAFTLAALAALLETLAVVLSVLPNTFVERPALLRATVSGRTGDTGPKC